MLHMPIMPKPLNLEGMQFGRLVAKYRAAENTSDNRARWVCGCVCGNTVTVAASELKRGKSRSCGCLAREESSARLRTHGFTGTTEYTIWCGIKKRCYDKRDHAYSNYGGRGITMCDEWKEDFMAFYNDMDPRPSSKHSIDRRENDKGYYKENCYWATPEEQANNKRTVTLYDFEGESLSISQIARKIGLSVSALHQRLLTMTLEEATRHRSITYDGETKPLVEWCGLFDLDPRDTYRRLLIGESFESIIRK